MYWNTTISTKYDERPFIKKASLARITFLLILFPFGLIAQQPLNLDFEIKSVEGIKRPWGWSPLSWGANFTMDSIMVKTGNYSLHSKCDTEETPCANQSLGFDIETYNLLGKNSTITGYIKGKEITKSVRISVNYTLLDDVSGTYSYKEQISEKLFGTFDWKKVTLNVKLPQSATKFSFNVHQEGLGEAWFDDFTLKIEGQEVSQVAATNRFSKENMEWLQHNVHSFNSFLPDLDTEESSSNELSFFKNAIGTSKIVALGESTHGTSEFFSLKHKLLQYAVTELGFRVFALEDHMLVGEIINAYVTQGKGSLEGATKGLFGTWSRIEILKMIQWIRDYNIKKPNDMVHFIGFDIQQVTRPIDSLTQFIKKQDLQFYEKHASTLHTLREKGKYPFMETDSMVKLDWIAKSESIYKALNAKKEKWLVCSKTKKQKLKIAYSVQYANIIQQYFKDALHNGTDLYRDQAMAENISWYLEMIYPKKKMIIWAHDSHVSRGDHDQVFTNFNRGISMGAFLSKKYKANYKSFGLATYNGDFLAFKTYAYKELFKAPLFPSPEGSLEEALHKVSLKTKLKNLYMDLPKSIDWLNRPIPIRFANHVSIDYGYWSKLVIPYQFDGLFFIDKTSSAKEP